MKLKNILYSIVVLFSLVSFSFTSFSTVTYGAEDEASSAIDKAVRDFEDQLPVIQEDFKESSGYENGNEEIYNNLKLQRDLQYKVYTVKNETLSSSYETTKSISTNISEEYLLNIPISNGDDNIVGVVRFYCYEDGSCQLYSFGEIDENELSINDQLDSIKDADQKKAVIFNRYSMIALYYESNNEEYIEPITESPYITFDSSLSDGDKVNQKSKNSGSLKAGDFISLIKEYDDDQDINADGTKVLYGSVINSREESTPVISKISMAVLVISAVALVCVLVMCFVKHKKIEE